MALSGVGYTHVIFPIGKLFVDNMFYIAQYARMGIKRMHDER